MTPAAEVVEPLTREEIERSPELRRQYASEYRAALTMLPDRDLARDAARLNLTAKTRGEEPVVTRESVERLGVKDLGETLSRLAHNLAELRSALAPLRTVWRMMERSADIER